MAIKSKKTKGTPDMTDKHVGARLRTRRSLLGMSQEKLADAIGLTFQQIQKYERGTNRISAGRLYQFSKILDVPISYFYDQLSESAANKPGKQYGFADNDQESFEPQEDLMNQKETINLIRAYYAIPDPKLRKDVFRFIRSMANRISEDDE